MSPTHASTVGLLLLACLTGGCEQEAPGPPPAATTTQPVAAPTETFQLERYCETVCERATDCGIREAAALAGSNAETEAVVQARRERSKVVRSCVEGCAARGPSDRLSEERALICQRREDCGELRSCLEAL